MLVNLLIITVDHTYMQINTIHYYPWDIGNSFTCKSISYLRASNNIGGDLIIVFQL